MVLESDIEGLKCWGFRTGEHFCVLGLGSRVSVVFFYREFVEKVYLRRLLTEDIPVSLSAFLELTCTRDNWSRLEQLKMLQYSPCTI